MFSYNLDTEIHKPLYLQVKDNIKELIREDKYKNGKALPSENTLVKNFGVSRHTIRKAMDSLVSSGLLIREQGKGTFLNPHMNKISTTLSCWESFTEEMEAKGKKFLYREDRVEVINNNPLIEKVFNQKGSFVKFEKVRGGLEPIVLFVSWFNPLLELDTNKDFLACKFHKLYRYLEKTLNIKVVKSKEEISCVGADCYIAKKLNIPKGYPLMKRERKVFDQDKNLIEYNLGYYRSDKFIYKIDIERKI